MTTQNLVLLKAIGAKMDYLTQRQRVISQNISHADTPGYRPHDLVEADFGKTLKDISGKAGYAVNKISISATSQGHVLPPNEPASAGERTQKDTYEVAPAGNAVILEEQLMMSGKTIMDYNTMTNLLQKNISMIKTAIGRAQ